MPQQCCLCHSTSLRDLDRLGVQRSVATDGQFIPLPLLKAQSTKCGLVQTTQKVEDIFAHLSCRDNYCFYRRPNMQVFDAPLYQRYAEWVASALPEGHAKYRVLEVGCGAAWYCKIFERFGPESGRTELSLRCRPARAHLAAPKFRGLAPSSSPCVSRVHNYDHSTGQ